MEYQLTHAMCMMMTMQKTPFRLFEFTSISLQHLEDIQPATYVGDESWRWLEDFFFSTLWTKNLVWSKFEFPLYDWVRIQECNSDSFFVGFSISFKFLILLLLWSLKLMVFVTFKNIFVTLSYYLVFWGFHYVFRLVAFFLWIGCEVWWYFGRI